MGVFVYCFEVICEAYEGGGGGGLLIALEQYVRLM